MGSFKEVVNVLKESRDSVHELDMLVQGDTSFLVQEIMGSLSRAINSLEVEKDPSENEKKMKVHSAKKRGNKRRISAHSGKRVEPENSSSTVRMSNSNSEISVQSSMTTLDFDEVFLNSVDSSYSGHQFDPYQ